MATVKVNYEMEVVAKEVNTRKGPSIVFQTGSVTYKKGQMVLVYEESNGWYRILNGDWINSDNGKNLKLKKDLGNNLNTDQQFVLTPDAIQQNFNSTLEGDTSGELDINVEEYGSLYNQGNSTPKLTTLKGIHGLPYQFMSSTDIKLSEIDKGIKFPFGRKYTEKIINRMPLLLLSPGTPVFLDGFSKRTKESILKQMSNVMQGKESELESMLNNTQHGRFYGFRFNYKDYYEYVNGMCWSSAIYLGLGDKLMDGTPYRRYDWSRYVNNGLKGFFSGSEYVCFYIEAENQITDSFSNNTGPSMLDTGLNKLSDLGKEIGFLLGAGAGIKWDAMHGGDYDATYEQISNMLGSYSNPAHIMERLKTGAVTVAGGGELIFPEIWKDSSYSKSYDITIKLNSPDGDTESIYRNLLVPTWHLMALTLPLQMGHNGFRSPFLIKGFYKGIINCEMGMITNMSLRKGGEGSWNIDGLPTEIEISFSFKDLYQILTMTSWKDTNMFVNNTPYLDFIAGMCGIVLNKPELLRKIDMYTTLQTNKPLTLPTRIQSGFNQAVSNVLMRAIGGR